MTESPPPPLSFDPVPGRARHDGWTPDRQRQFMAALARIGLVARAAQSVGMSAKSAYALRLRAGDDSSFAAAWNAALDLVETQAIEIGLDRALRGEQVAVFFRGRQIGSWTRHDDRLLIATLRAVAAQEARQRRTSTR